MAVWGAESGDIQVSVPEDVAVVTLARPDKLNALTAAMRRELAAIFRYFGDGHSVRGIVVTGSGRAFSAGMDLREAADLPPGGLIADLESFHDMTRAVLETRVPVVGALNGIAVGGACELTLCFDARLGTPAVEYFLPENGLGLTISNASSVLLPRLAGPRAALRLVLESPRIGAQEALDLGLLDEIVDPDGLIEAATDLVHRWTPPGAATAVHLPLLRPSRAMVEQAMAAETEAASGPDAAGLAQAGISRFIRRGE
jgi:enoyl-CoA hydratase/carnithine racemase